MKPLRAAFIAAAVFVATSAHAATIYKCVARDGRTEYRDSQCDDKPGELITVRPNVTSPIDESATRAENEALSARISARKRAAQDEAIRQRLLAEATAEPPSLVEAEAPDYIYGFAPDYRKRHPIRKTTRLAAPSHSVIIQEKKRR